MRYGFVKIFLLLVLVLSAGIVKAQWRIDQYQANAGAGYVLTEDLMLWTS